MNQNFFCEYYELRYSSIIGLISNRINPLKCIRQCLCMLTYCGCHDTLSIAKLFPNSSIRRSRLNAFKCHAFSRWSSWQSLAVRCSLCQNSRRARQSRPGRAPSCHRTCQVSLLPSFSSLLFFLFFLFFPFFGKSLDESQLHARRGQNCSPRST